MEQNNKKTKKAPNNHSICMKPFLSYWASITPTFTQQILFVKL